MYIAIEGCAHGELDKIYDTIKLIEQKKSIKVEMLICCGDFESIRNRNDLECMAVPVKYRHMQTFWQYYCGKKTAPVLTIFIGGNHEATNYLQELPYGGWVAPNIYYLGYAGVLQYKGLRIGGMSGIFKQHDYTKGHFEKSPYSESTKRSAYHVRQLEVFRLCQIKNPIDVMLSHDWPNGIVNHGDCDTLLRRKKHFAADVHSNCLGSTPAWKVLHQLRPKYWFSGHLHVKFSAVVHHPACNKEQKNQNTTTKFLALDKCLPRRDFLQVIDVEADADAADSLMYDAEWLAILKETNQLLSVSPRSGVMPTEGLHEKWDYSVNEDAINNINSMFDGDLKIPENFTADPELVHHPEKQQDRASQPQCTVNPQTTELCAKLEINDPVMTLLQSQDGDISLNNSSFLTSEQDDSPSMIISNASINPDEIDLDDDDDDDEDCEDKVEETKSSESFVVIGKIAGDGPKLTSTPVSKSGSQCEMSAAKKMKTEPTSRSLLDLPAPVFDEQRDDEAAAANKQDDVSCAENHNEESPQVIDSSMPPSDCQKSSTKKRVFKRRNADAYAANGDDE